MRHVFLLPDEIDQALAFKNKDVNIFWMPLLAEGYIGEFTDGIRVESSRPQSSIIQSRNSSET
jgi:hypothetical protein